MLRQIIKESNFTHLNTTQEAPLKNALPSTPADNDTLKQSNDSLKNTTEPFKLNDQDHTNKANSTNTTNTNNTTTINNATIANTLNNTKEGSNALESLLKTLVTKLNNNELKSKDLIDQFNSFR